MDDAIKEDIQAEVGAFMDARFECAADAHAYLTELLYEQYLFGYEEGWGAGHDSGLMTGYDRGHEDGCNSVSVASPGCLDGN